MATPLIDRWQKAYGKVEARCLGISKTARGYEVKSDSGRTYLVTGRGNVATGCTCKAGKHDPDGVCWHKASVYALIGAFDHLRPQPANDVDRAFTQADRALLNVALACSRFRSIPTNHPGHGLVSHMYSCAVDAAERELDAAGFADDAKWDRIVAAERLFA